MGRLLRRSPSCRSMSSEAALRFKAVSDSPIRAPCNRWPARAVGLISHSIFYSKRKLVRLFVGVTRYSGTPVLMAFRCHFAAATSPHWVFCASLFDL